MVRIVLTEFRGCGGRTRKCVCVCVCVCVFTSVRYCPMVYSSLYYILHISPATVCISVCACTEPLRGPAHSHTVIKTKLKRRRRKLGERRRPLTMKSDQRLRKQENSRGPGIPPKLRQSPSSAVLRTGNTVNRTRGTYKLINLIWVYILCFGPTGDRGVNANKSIEQSPFSVRTQPFLRGFKLSKTMTLSLLL